MQYASIWLEVSMKILPLVMAENHHFSILFICKSSINKDSIKVQLKVPAGSWDMLRCPRLSLGYSASYLSFWVNNSLWGSSKGDLGCFGSSSVESCAKMAFSIEHMMKQCILGLDISTGELVEGSFACKLNKSSVFFLGGHSDSTWWNQKEDCWFVLAKHAIFMGPMFFMKDKTWWISPGSIYWAGCRFYLSIWCCVGSGRQADRKTAIG